jgi:hypothetical protein
MAGRTNSFTTKSSATFENIGLWDIGQRSFLNSWTGTMDGNDVCSFPWWWQTAVPEGTVENISNGFR